MQKPELIAPAGDLEKLKIAFQFGADSVYASTPNFSMRTREIGFTQDSLKEGIEYAHLLGKKVYLTLNTFPHSSDIEALKKHAKKTIDLKPDAIIIADPGVLDFVRKNTKIPIHLSTQANTTNYLAANFWKKQGVDRIVLARELSLTDINLIAKKSKIELESFVHGAMCMAYSGRCQISNYLTGRDPNKGACVQACRFKYKMYGLEEELRPGEIFPIYEDDNGSYVLNSKDLCMIDHIPELVEAGIKSFKIEGRMKGIYYLGIIVRAYRKAIDLYFDSPAGGLKKYKKECKNFIEEVKKTSSRGFTTGFYFKNPSHETNNYETSRASGSYTFVGVVKEYDKEKQIVKVSINNRLRIGSKLEIVTPGDIVLHKLTKMLCKGEKATEVHAGSIIEFKINKYLPENSLIRVNN